MTNMLIKETGNSRFIKSAIPVWTTWEAALTLLRSGEFPVDMLDLNDEGILQAGTPLSKENLLTDETAAALGLEESDPTVNQAFAGIAQMIDAINTSLGGISFKKNETTGALIIVTPDD